MQKIRQFLEFNGKNLVFLSKDGTYYIALKPICEVLNIDFIRHNRNAKEDPIFGPSLSKQTILVPGDSQPRKFVCMPERYIYGWIMSIRSESKELIEYKKACYDILYNFFHGTITRRKEILQQAVIDSSRAEEIRLKLANNELVNELNACEGRILRAGKELKKLDNDIISDIQLNLFTSNNQ